MVGGKSGGPVAGPTVATPRPGSAPLPDRVTMPLLALITREAVDEDYVHAARRRAAGGGPSSPRWSGHRGAAVATALFGLLVALAAVQTARNADVQEASRSALVDRIRERQVEVSSARDRITELRNQNAALQAVGSRTSGDLTATTGLLRGLRTSTGFVAVSGPGLRITVSDNPDESADGRVRATDLRRLVNGLWDAGAEAIAINGRRLSALSAIVNFNIAVSVNRSPLTPPYVVSAIGDPQGMRSRLPTTASGAQFQGLADQFGFVVDQQNESELVLPEAPDVQLRLRWAEPDPVVPDNIKENP
jgi:uncharacterized protein YlxW (UPF0749 family)